MGLHENMLLVPLRIRGLTVGKTGEAEYAGATQNFLLMGDILTGDRLQTPVFTTQGSLEPGVHLHFILPEALVHGTQEEDGELCYPAIPNRWIVNRINVTAGIVNTFVVESDHLASRPGDHNRGSVVYPGETPRWLGRSGAYETLPVGEDYLNEPLTAAGWGEPGFYGYYPNCRNVLGFHDDMRGVKAGSRLFYQVCGWYSHKEQDPLYGLSEEKFSSRLLEMNWQISKYVVDTYTKTWKNEDDSVILCHGTLYDVLWQGKESSYDSGMPEKSPKIAIGNSSYEALAALLCQEADKSEDRRKERLLNLFMADLLSQWVDTDGLTEVEEQLHQNTFQTVDGGRRWMLRPDKAVKEQGLILPEMVRIALEELNRKQKDLEATEKDFAFSAKQTYFSWYHCQDDLRSEYRKEFMACLERLADTDKQLKLKREGCAAARTGLEDILKPHEHWELLEMPGERYYMPNEPALLFWGGGVSQDTWKEREKDSGSLECRIFQQVITAVSVEVKQEQCERLRVTDAFCQTFSAELMTGGYLHQNLPVPLKRLLDESFLFSQDAAGQIMEGVRMRLGGQAKGAQMSQAIAAECISYVGCTPAHTALCTYFPPWEPVYMEWSINYYPDPNRLENWMLEDIDYCLRYQFDAKESGILKGRMLLTPHVLPSLCETIGNYMKKMEEHNEDRKALEKNDSYRSLKDLLTIVQEKEILSQQLSGFNAFFLSEKNGMRLSIPYLWLRPKTETDVRAVLEAKGLDEPEQLRLMNLVDSLIDTDPHKRFPYTPFRAGYGRLEGLRLIDSYGRIRILCEKGKYELNSPLAVAENMDMGGEGQSVFAMTPRLMTPARLVCEWDEYEPVFGWLVPDYISQTLMVYGPEGSPLGIIQMIDSRDGSQVIRWMDLYGG